MTSQQKDDKMYALEADLTTKVKTYLDTLRPLGKFTKMSDRFHIGVSDFIGCYKGRFVAIELKAEDGVPTMHQIEYITGIIQAGGYATLARTIREVKDLIARIDTQCSLDSLNE